MEESEDNLSAEDINNAISPVVKNKPKKRSLVERELETSLTARVISPISAGDGCSTSRYGRARRHKNESFETSKAAKMLKSPKTEISPKSTIQSPVYKMHASNSPIKLDSQKPEQFENQIENIYSENNSLSRFGSTEKKISPSKKYPKVYIRKDLIQLKDKDKEAEETVVLIKNMFSPVKSAQKSNRSSLERSLEKGGKRKLTSKDTQSVVKTLDFDEKDVKSEDDKNKKDTGKAGLSKSEIFEVEAKSEYQVGDLAWARMGTYPFWPCIITREPGSGLFVKTKLFGRTVRNILNVTFFGDNGRRSWIADSMLRPFLGQLEFETARAHFTSEAKKKDPKLYAAYFISERKMPQWLLSVEEAETLLREPKRLRIDILNSMLMKVRPEKVTPRSEKGKRVTRTDSDVSLSESLYDTLFSEDDSKGNDSDRRNKGKQSLDVSDVVTACLDNMAAKTGITKIQKQSHMDRWLLKAKTKTPEKSQLKSQAVQKSAKSSAKTHRPKSQKPYQFRSRHNESQNSESSILNDNNKPSTSSDYKSVSVSCDDVIMDNSNDKLHNESNVTEIICDSISETKNSDKEALENDISIFKSPLNETENKESNEGKNVLNKIKQSIDSDENMPSTSSVDISGMSTSFEISRVDTQSSDREIVESDANQNVSELTDDKSNHLNMNIYDTDKSGPITSSPKNSKTDIENVLDVDLENESVEESATRDKPKLNECTSKESHDKDEYATNMTNDSSNLNIKRVKENTIENKSNKLIMNETENESLVIQNSNIKLDKNVTICNGVHIDDIENNSNFRNDRKIKTRQKTDSIVAEFKESKESCKDDKSNVCELNIPNTRSKRNCKSDVNVNLGSDKSKLKINECIDNEINRDILKIPISQDKSIVNKNNKLTQSFDSSNHVEILHNSIMDIETSGICGIDREQSIEEKHNGLLLEYKQKEVSDEGTFNCKAINRNDFFLIPKTKLKENALSESKREESLLIESSPRKGNSHNDLKALYNNEAFQKYLELKQDNVMDEHPELPQDEITSYLYKTWQYETKDIIDNKALSESNKTPAKGTNYKALDKERGRKKLVRKKPGDFTPNKVILPPNNKSPVNGYHKEIKPIIISPKNKIVFLPRKHVTDAVKDKITFSDFKFGNTPVIGQVQIPDKEKENKVSISSIDISKASIVETVTDTKNESAELPSLSKAENASNNSPNNKTSVIESKLLSPQNETVSKTEFNVNEPTEDNKQLPPVAHNLNISLNVPNADEIKRIDNKNSSLTENKINNELETVTLTRSDAVEPTCNDTDVNDQKCTHDHNGQDVVESKVLTAPATKTAQIVQNDQMSINNNEMVSITENINKNIKEIKPNIVNSNDHMKHTEENIFLSSEKNEIAEPKVLNNDDTTKIKERQLKITLNRINLSEQSVLNEREKASINAPMNILQNENETDNIGLSPNNKTDEGDLLKTLENENKCLIKTSIASEEENGNPLNTSVQTKAIEVTQIKDVECKENTETISSKHDKKCVDNDTVCDNNEVGENKVQHSLKDQIETLTTNLKHCESDSYLDNSTNSDKEEQNITHEKLKVTLSSNEDTIYMKNNETESVPQAVVTEINSNVSSKQDIENIQENLDFQRYLQLKQDSVFDEHPELSHEQVIQYLYKTWLYEENNKPEKKKNNEVDQTSLVKGISNLNSDKDKKRKKLSRRRPSDSIDIKKKQPVINQFFKQNGFQDQFKQSFNGKTDFQVVESNSKMESQQTSKVSVSDCKINETEVNNIDQEPKTSPSSNTNNVIDGEELKDQSLNESTDYEPDEDNSEKLKSKGSASDHDNFDSASSSSTDYEDEMAVSLEKRKKKQGTQKKIKTPLMEPDFVRYLELRQDSVTDEHPELSHDEVVQYLYKTWLYEEDNKSEKKISDEVDQTSLVKGVSNIFSDKKRRKLRLKRPSSDANKKPPTIINKFLTQNGYHEYHDKSSDADEQEASTFRTKSYHQNDNVKEPETNRDDTFLDEETTSADKFGSAPASSSDSELEMSLSEKKQIWKEKQKSEKSTLAEKKKALMDAEFVRYLEIRQDYVMDEHPELTEEEITNYLYKTWLYEESIKNEKKRDDEVDQTSLVKGVDVEPKKPKRKYKIVKEDSQESFKVSEVFAVEPKEKSKRSKARPYYNEEISDIEEELALFEIFRKKKLNKPNLEQQIDPSKPNQELDLASNTEEISNIEDYVYDELDMVEMYFEQLTTPKPNVFKGLIRERVCEICEKVSNLVKCKTCHGMFHADCVKNQHKTHTEEKTPSRGRKKKRKYQRRIKNSDGTFMDDDGHSDEKTQDGSDPNLSIEAEREPIVADAEDFEAKASAKMREILGDLDNVQYDYESTNVAISWNARPGKCQIVDVKLEMRRPEEAVDAANFRCNDCEKFDTPKCFVCKSPVSPKECVEYRQKCQVAHCYKYYHLECLAHWPQTQFNGGDVRNKSKEGFEAMSCPRHVCHTCVSDDPRGCKTRFSGDKLARCVRCPATYHSFTKCLPAGSQILTASQIICPRHYEHRPGKVPCHVNTGWCFICALGGTLICCEYCPTSFHAECLNIDPPEGGYMCEDCETGRLPLYGEMVWVKLGHYRWWPGIILHPSQIPTNIMAVKHSQGEFVVRFFGQYDHYWVNRGRVFPFQEGDTGKISSQKSKIDSAFTLAVEHASRACEILKKASADDEESQDIASSLLPPHYVKLKVNKPVGSLVNRRVDLEESSLTQCECEPADREPCGPYSQCLNRMLLTECGPTCRAGERCNNRAFEKRQYPKMAPYRTPHRGWGLRCLEDIKAGQFVIEYVGELLDEAEFQRRMRRQHEVRDQNFYFLTLDKERMIDAGPKGNLARFMNHSCEPNCETQKWTVLGDVRVGLFAIDDIPANSELTFNYNLESAGIEKKQCMCGAKRCSGYIGAKPKQSDPQPKKNKIVKKIQKTKKTQSPQAKRPRGRPCKPKELTEIEKDLLIIKNATNISEKDIISIKNSSVSSDSEYSERCSVDSKDGKSLKRKRSSQESLTMCLKRVKTQDGDEFRID